MSGDSFGRLLKLTTFCESHGKAIGGILEGFPAGVQIDLKQIQLELDRRKPGKSSITSQRKESDIVDFLSGIFESKSLGTPIGFICSGIFYTSVNFSIKDIQIGEINRMCLHYYNQYTVYPNKHNLN